MYFHQGKNMKVKNNTVLFILFFNIFSNYLQIWLKYFLQQNDLWLYAKSSKKQRNILSILNGAQCTVHRESVRTHRISCWKQVLVWRTVYTKDHQRNNESTTNRSLEALRSPIVYFYCRRKSLSGWLELHCHGLKSGKEKRLISFNWASDKLWSFKLDRDNDPNIWRQSKVCEKNESLEIWIFEARASSKGALSYEKPLFYSIEKIDQLTCEPDKVGHLVRICHRFGHLKRSCLTILTEAIDWKIGMYLNSCTGEAITLCYS